LAEFDFIIVGAGTAGCLLADRLTESGKFRVLVLEAGGSERRFMVSMPIGYGHSFYNPRVNWMYSTGPQDALAGRSSYWPRGKILGGSSSINAMVFVRGQRRDFDDWKAAGNPGWGWGDVLPFFRSFERFHGRPSHERGDGGLLDVTDVARSVHPLCMRFLTASEQSGLKRTEDYNGNDQEGVAVYQITTRNGKRASAATAFLRPAMKRSNLAVVTNALASKLIFEGRKCIGVEYFANGRAQRDTARREVILSAGAVGSPALLQRSGVGSARLMQALEIPTVHDLPSVGEHLQDHLGVDYLFRSREPTLNSQLRSWNGRLRLGLRYLAFRDGPLSLSVNQAGGFVRANPKSEWVDTQLYFSPVSYSKPTPGVRRLTLPDPFPGFFLGISHCRPKSSGSIRIASPDPAAPPIIEPNYLSAPDDMQAMLAGVRLIRKIAGQPALASIIDGEMLPGAAVTTDAELADDIRRRASSVFHASCTCRMGPDPASAVVDHRLRVHGLDGLRVIDASVFPYVTSGNTNAPTLMVAEKGAHMVMDDNS